jgi:site-specific recombinase XerC
VSVGGQRDRALLLCLLDTVCRAAEFLALDIGDVDLVAALVRARWCSSAQTDCAATHRRCSPVEHWL